MIDIHAEKLFLLPENFVFLGQGPLKTPHLGPSEPKNNLMIWDATLKIWRFIECQGAATSFYAARENSQAHLLNV